MKMSATLFWYLVRTYVFNFLALFSILLAIVYLFDMVELIRRAAKFDDVSLALVFQMGLFKLPEVGQVLFPFVVLFSALYTFWQLNRRSELVIIRASGLSVWQLLLPLIVIACCIGFLQMMVINPVSSVLLGRYDLLEGRYLKREDTQVALFKQGLWLRQSYQENNEKGYVIIHSPKIKHKDWVLETPILLFFTLSDEFVKRMDAKSGYLTNDMWIFEDAVSHTQTGEIQTLSKISLPTKLTARDVEDSFSSPETMSFWRLPSHIQTLEDAGFNADRLKIIHQNLISQPLMLTAMILLAAVVSVRTSRKSNFNLITLGVFTGFFIFFFSSYVQALGTGGQIPVFLAAWSPALVTFLFAISVLMRLEDG